LTALRKRYARASKKGRSAILNEFVQTTGYHRKYAIALLTRSQPQRHGPIRRPRPRLYTLEDTRTVLKLAALFDEISSKRLRAALDATLSTLRRQGHLCVTRECYQHLRRISPATLDRMRRAARPLRLGPRRRGLTKPGSLLKSQIPIRTFAEWDQTQPGFVEIDLVDHSGGLARGDFAHTLNATDVLSGWTEMRAVRTKAQKFVFAALQQIRTQLPIPLLGIDSDNGSEFINDELLRYCQTEHLTFTRGRAGRKNDNPFVEQKNWSVVRRLVGYGRFDTSAQVDQLNRLYAVYRQYVNFFLPIMKLKEKIHVGHRVQKKFDAPQTPYARLLASPQVAKAVKAKLRAVYTRLDVVHLKRTLDELLAVLRPSSLQ
jgi:hypothetical protein